VNDSGVQFVLRQTEFEDPPLRRGREGHRRLERSNQHSGRRRHGAAADRLGVYALLHEANLLDRIPSGEFGEVVVHRSRALDGKTARDDDRVV
jgi:hypothetical protein